MKKLVFILKMDNYWLFSIFMVAQSKIFEYREFSDNESFYFY